MKEKSPPQNPVAVSAQDAASPELQAAVQHSSSFPQEITVHLFKLIITSPF